MHEYRIDVRKHTPGGVDIVFFGGTGRVVLKTLSATHGRSGGALMVLP